MRQKQRGARGVIIASCMLSSWIACDAALKDRLQEIWRAEPPSHVFLSLDRTPSEELAVLHRTREQFPRHAGLAHRRALLLFVLGYRGEAETAYRAARRVAPDWEFMMFHALQALSSPTGEAWSAYREAVHVDRRHPEVRWALGFLGLASRRYVDALEHYDQWKRLQPPARPRSPASSGPSDSSFSSSMWQTATTYNHAVAALLAGDVDLAERLAREWEDRSVVHWRTCLLQGHLYACRGRDADALAAYEDALRLAPMSVEPAFYTAVAAGHLHRWPVALAAIERARSGDPRAPRLLAERDRLLAGALEDARAALDQGRTEHAAALAALYLTHEPGQPDAAELRRQALDDHDRARRLDRALGEALALEPIEPDRALALYEALLASHPDHPVALQKSAVLRRHADERLREALQEAHEHDRLFHPHRALAVVDRVLAMKPGQPDALAFKRRVEERLAAGRDRRESIDRWSMEGEVAAGDGQWAEAIRLWKSALEFDYYNVTLREKIRLAEQELNTATKGNQAERTNKAEHDKQ